MNPHLPLAPATPWSRDRRPRWGVAAVLAVGLVLAGLLWAPVDWLRAVFGREFGRVDLEVAERVEPLEGIRLIPVPTRAPAAAEQAPPTVTTPSFRSDPDEDPAPETTADPTFVWDPTTAWSASDELLAPGPPDSILHRAALLDALSVGRVERSFAYFDTTQVGAAHRQFDWMDTYMNDVLAPLYEAEGRAARIADIYRRTVTEAEEEEGM